jgi:hypothetical protein
VRTKPWDRSAQWTLRCSLRENKRVVRKPACKPGSVPPVAATAIYLACWLPSRSSSLPESHSGPDQPCSLIWPCSRWGLPSQPVARLLVGSYIKGPRSPHRFTLTEEACGLSGGMLSVALSRSLATLPLSAAGRLGRWALPTTASCGARTFLSPVCPQAAQSELRADLWHFRAAAVRPARGPTYYRRAPGGLGCTSERLNSSNWPPA